MIGCAGHWKLSHTVKNLVLIQANLIVQFALFALVRASRDLFRSFGFVKYQPAFISFTLFNIILAPLDEVGSSADSEHVHLKLSVSHSCYASAAVLLISLNRIMPDDTASASSQQINC